MAARTVEIKITGDGLGYYAEMGEVLAERINAMVEKPKTRDKATILYSIAYADNEEYYDAHKRVAMEQLKELMAVISDKERLELYRYLNTVFRCRM